MWCRDQSKEKHVLMQVSNCAAASKILMGLQLKCILGVLSLKSNDLVVVVYLQKLPGDK